MRATQRDFLQRRAVATKPRGSAPAIRSSRIAYSAPGHRGTRRPTERSGTMASGGDPYADTILPASKTWSYRRARRVRNDPGVRPYDLWGLDMDAAAQEAIASTSDGETPDEDSDGWQLVHTARADDSNSVRGPHLLSTPRRSRGSGVRQRHSIPAGLHYDSLQRTRRTLQSRQRGQHANGATQVEMHALAASTQVPRRQRRSSAQALHLSQMQAYHQQMVQQREGQQTKQQKKQQKKQQLLDTPGRALAAALPRSRAGRP